MYSWMMPFCISLGGGSQEMLMLVLLPSFVAATVTALGGALGTVGGWCDNINIVIQGTMKS